MKHTVFARRSRQRVNRSIVFIPGFRVRQLAKTCEFSNVDKEIKEHIILTASSSSFRRRALRENPTLEGLLKLGRALELSEKQAIDVEDI